MKLSHTHTDHARSGPGRHASAAYLLFAIVAIFSTPDMYAQYIMTYGNDGFWSNPPSPPIPPTPPDAPALINHDVCRVTLRGFYNGSPDCQILLGESEVSPNGTSIDGLAFIYSNSDYQLHISAGQLNSLTLNIQAPPGYHVWLDDTPRKQVHIGSGSEVYESYTLQLRTEGGGSPGTGGSVKLGEELAWGVNLGRLNNGNLAGAMVLRAELDASQIRRGNIGLRGVNNQVVMTRDASGVRQIEAPEVFVDVNDVIQRRGNVNEVIGFTADFYPKEAMGNADPETGIREIDNDANYYVRHTVMRDSESPNHLVASTSYSHSSVTTSIEQQGGTWVKNIGDEMIVETVETGTSATQRWEITTTKDGSNNEGPGGVARKTKRIYNTAFTWGHLMPANASDQGTLTDVIIDPDGAALATHYEYYTDPGLKGSYAQIKSITYSDGSWAKYEYYEQGETGYGQIKCEYHPWRDGPATPDDATENNCHVIEYTYAADGEGVQQLIASKIQKINGVTVARQESTHTFSEHVSVYYEYYPDPDSAEPELARLWKQETRTWPDGNQNAAPLVSTIRRYKPDPKGTLGIFDGLPYSVIRPDGSKTIYANSRGAVSYEVAYHGMAAPAPGLTYYVPWTDGPFDYEGLELDFVYLKPNHSTRTVLMKKNGRIKLEETSLYTGNLQFSTISSKEYIYDASGRLIEIKTEAGTIYSATWEDGFKTGEKGADGIQYTYDPDAVMRVKRAIKTGADMATVEGVAFAAQTDIITDYAYNAAGNIVKRKVSGGDGLSLEESFEYDLAGRLTKSTAPNGDTTTIGYDTRTQTTTHPGGAARTVEMFRDGRIKSETGTGIVGVFYDYGIDDGGFRWTETQAGTGPKTRSTYDWTGCLRFAQTPLISGTSGTDTHTTTYAYDGAGRLARTETPGLAPTLYEYDPVTGELTGQGLLCGSGTSRATLDPALGDRVIRFESGFVLRHEDREEPPEGSLPDEPVWHLEQKSYHLAGSGTIPVLRSHTFTRLNTIDSRVESFDVYGNKTVQTTTVNPGSRLVTQITTVPGSNIEAVSYVYNGLTVHSRDVLGQSVSYDYDSLGRAIRTRRPGKTAIETVYDPVSGRVQKTQFADAAHTLITAYEYDAAGRVSKTTNGDGAEARFTYDIAGRVLSRYGTGVAPVAYEYDALGRLIKQTTWRGAVTNTLPSGDTDKNITTFEYLGDFALVKKTTDALGNAIGYSYDTLGRITALARSRKLADNETAVTVSYAYDAKTGELTGKSYNDGTPALSYAYNPFGQLASVTDALGTRSFAYANDATGRLLSETLPAWYRDDTDDPTGLRRLTCVYDTGAPHGEGSAYIPLNGRLKSTALVNSADAIEASAAYWFLGNGMTGKIEVADPTVTEGNQRAFQYAWMPWQPALLHQSVETKTGLTRTIGYADAYWDSPTRVATGLTGTPAPEPLAAYDMTYDKLGRVTTLQQDGALFSGYGEPTHRNYTYNLRGQLTATLSRMGAAGASENRPMPGRQYTFAYDNAGARTAASHDGSLSQSETVNALGQVTQKENKSIHVSGVAGQGIAVATCVDEDITAVRGVAAVGRFWSMELSVNSATDSAAGRVNANVYLGKPASSPEEANIIKTVPLALFMSPKKEAFAYDADGNLISDGQWTYTYDAENRLVAMQTKDALIPALLAHTGGERPLLINFTYDYASRRAAKRVQEKIDGQWQERYHHRYVYQGSSMVAEIDANTRKILRSFAWGATGELLMIHDRTASTAQTYLPVRDASGSVTGILCAGDKTIVATYEYDPNGNLLRAQGAYAQKNPFTWAGGWMDWETGLTNAGSVYYAPRLGRFINGGHSGGGGGVAGSFGVAPSAGYQPLRSYPRPAARRNAVTERVSTIDPAERAAYESAWAAFETAWASYETEAVAYEKWLRDHPVQFVGPLGGSEAEDTEAGYFGDFLRSSQNYNFTGTFGSFDMGLSDVYLAITITYASGAKREIYTDGTSMKKDASGNPMASAGSDGSATFKASNNVASGNINSYSVYRGNLKSGKIYVHTGNMDEKNKAAASANAHDALALLMHSKTFLDAYNTIINLEKGLVINPVDYSGGGTISGNNLIFGTLAGMRADGSIVYPAYIIAHELAHMFDSFDKTHKEWQLEFVPGSDTSKLFAILDAAAAPNPREYYAYMFAEQVSREVFSSTGINIGSQSGYVDSSIVTISERGWIPKK